MECVFSSNLEMVDKALIEARKFIKFRQEKLNEFEFRLALREALNNAVIHGNRQREAFEVSLTIASNGRILEINVADQGPGFAWQQRLKQITAKHDQPGGRGLILIKSFGYSISYNKSGNVLTLKKALN
jgi:serine/threonine-protein kinase RsbW